MKFPSIKILAQSAGNTIKRFPFEILFALAGTIAATVNFNNRWFNTPEETWCYRVMMMANLGLLLSLSATLFTGSKNYSAQKSWLIRGLAAIAGVLLLFVLNPDVREFDFVRFLLFSLGFHLMVSFAAFTIKGHVQGFWQFNKTLFLRILASALYSGVLFLGLAAAIAATRFLFNLDIDNDIYPTLFAWIAGMFNTLFFLAGIPADTAALDTDESYPKPLKVFTQYVLIPLATVYVLILLAYEVKIAAEWSLPKGMVSNLILGYAVFGILSILLVYPIRNLEENKWIKTYARSFYILLIPLLVLLFLAMLARVLPYGITEQRYFLLVLAGWLTFITAYFLFSRKQNIKVIPVSLCVVSLLAIYGPQSASSVSACSQRNILIKIFDKYGKYKDGKLLPLGDVKLSAADGKEAYEKADYLARTDKMHALEDHLNPDVAAISDSLTRAAKNGNNYYRYELKMKQSEWLRSYLGLDKVESPRFSNSQSYNFEIDNNQAIDVREYDYVIKMSGYYGYGTNNSADTIRIPKDGLTLVRSAGFVRFCWLKLNNAPVQVDMQKLGNMLIAQEDSLKKYAKKDTYSGYSHQYTLPPDMLLIKRETPRYTVVFRIEKLSFSKRSGNNPDSYDAQGYYLIKKK